MDTDTHKDPDISALYNKRREELIGFNEKQTLNDEFLGAPLWFGDQREQMERLGLVCLEYLWNVVSVIDLMETLRFDESVERVSFYQSVVNYVREWKPQDISSLQPFD